LPPTATERRRTRDGEPFRRSDYQRKRWREQDLPMLGWRHRSVYDTKSTFITLVIEDGADPTIIGVRDPGLPRQSAARSTATISVRTGSRRAPK
jgi:hypothetical protein